MGLAPCVLVLLLGELTKTKCKRIVTREHKLKMGPAAEEVPSALPLSEIKMGHQLNGATSKWATN